MGVGQVVRTLNGERKELEHKEGITYEGKAKAPLNPLKTPEERSYYPLQISAEDDAGNITTEAEMLEVMNKPIFPLKLISATPAGEEQGFMNCEFDFDIGDTNDFELRMELSAWEKEKCDYGYRVYIPGTEYGGLLEKMRVFTASGEIAWNGYTWRGLLTQKVLEPPENEEHLILNGELNDVIRKLIADKFDSLFVVPEINTGIILNGWKVDRFVTLYDAIKKFLDAKGYRLQIAYKKEAGPEYGYVELQAVPVKDYSDNLKYDNSCNIKFEISDNRCGINHLVCAGEGEGQERIRLHLYVQKDGSIGKTQYYKGLAEREAVYNFTSADMKELEEEGTKRLKELQNRKSIELFVDDIDLEIGDIVGGREDITGTEVRKPVVGKILRIEEGRPEIEYKVEGEN